LQLSLVHLAVSEELLLKDWEKMVLGKLEDIANAVATLVSDDAHWITGQSIRANGGIV